MNANYQAAAQHFPDPFRLLIRDSVDSTNDSLRDLARDGAPHGLVLLAREQRRGRGRRGNTWSAPAGENLTFSVLLRPEQSKPLWPRLALASGLALAEALESYGLQAGIKWPNDVWIGMRKVAGILVEAGEDFVIVGIGINVGTTKFPPEIAATATSLQLAMGTAPACEEVLCGFIQRFAIRQGGIDADFPGLVEAIKQRCVLSGERVMLQTSSGPKSGVVKGIGSGGELLLDTPDGTESLIQADEVRIIS
ncbi:MAG: biotin--[acetyl-CoA-carboxylase] ligase [Akkermansiaceae bacterium]|nr:biotin--[acetyl-CoA-carboxylase] ligase [Akkermansiaceae bacterium]